MIINFLNGISENVPPLQGLVSVESVLSGSLIAIVDDSLMVAHLLIIIIILVVVVSSCT